MHSKKEIETEVGDVVLIAGESIKMEEIFKDKDDMKHRFKLRTPKSHIERPIQYLCLLKFHSNLEKSAGKFKNTRHNKLNVDAKNEHHKEQKQSLLKCKQFNIGHYIGREC